MNKLKKSLLIFLTVIALGVVMIILFISPISKYLVEKYDEKYTGRNISVQGAYVNPFTGYVHFSHVRIFELNSDTVFLSMDGLSANFNMTKLLSNEYEISSITLDRPKGMIIQNKKELNFSDLIEKFSNKKDSIKRKDPLHVSILDIKIVDGEFHYFEKVAPINYLIKHVNIESVGKHWNADTMNVGISFTGMTTGDIKADMTFYFEEMRYKLSAVAVKYDLQIIDQYLKDLTNYQHFGAKFDAKIRASGSFRDREDIHASGLLSIHDFHLGKSITEDYASFDKLVLDINELSPKDHKYLFDSVSLSTPYFKYERYDSLDNVQTMFGKKGANVKSASSDPAKFNLIIELGRYIKVLSKKFFKSDYQISRLAIYNGSLKYSDYSLAEKFTADLKNLNAVADSIDKDHAWVSASLRSDIEPYGDLKVDVKINPNDSSDFDLRYHLQKMPVSHFNPYLITHTSFPLDRGTIEFKGNWRVRNSIISSDNHLVILDPRLNEKVRRKDTRWIPMPLIFFFIRERGNVIDYEIPITGNLKDPNFKVKDVLFDLLENILVKAPTTPYRMEVKNVEVEIEKAISLNWQMRNSTLLNKQEKFLEKMVDFLKENPNASIKVYPMHYTLKEKEYLLFFQAKKKYFLAINQKKSNAFTEDDSLMVEKMSVKDPAFMSYLNKQVNDPLVFTVQEKCTRIIDPPVLELKFAQLNENRYKIFMAFFKEEQVQKQVVFAKSVSTIPYNGFSFYRIEYKGEIPEYLLEAYQQMYELNNNVPRNKFKRERKNGGS